jgi:hypothetical protein
MSVDAMTTEAAGERRLLDSEEFRDVIGRFGQRRDGDHRRP